MIPLAIIEHLQKILHLLSLFFPVALFFLAGLALAWWIWYRYARRLHLALAEHDRLTAELATVYESDHDLGTRFTGLLKKSNHDWETKLSHSHGRIANLTSDLAAETTRFADLDLSFGKHKEKSEVDLKNLRDARSNLQQELQDQRVTITSLESTRDQLSGEVETLDASLKERDAKISSLEAIRQDQENELGQLTAERSDLQAQVRERDTKLGSLEGDLSQKVAAFGLLQTQFDDGKGEAKKLRGKIADLDSHLSGKEQELDKLRTQFAGLEKYSAAKEKEIATLRGKIGELEASTSGQQQKISGLEDQLSERESKLGSLKGDLSQKVAAFGLLQSQLDRGKSESAELKSEISNFKSTVGAKDEKLSALQAQLGKLEESSAEKQKQIEQLRGRIAELGDQDATIKTLQRTLTEREKKAASQEQEITTLSAKANKLKLLEMDFADYKKSVIDPIELARVRDEMNSANANHQGTKDKLSEAVQQLQAERNKKPEPIRAATFFAKTGAIEEKDLGFLYRNQPAKVDDLTEISGVGPVLQPKLNKFGIYQHKQIALWSQENIDAFSEKLDFKGRIEREQWVNQAADLHRKYHGEPLAPMVNIYHKPPVAKAPKKPKPASPADKFKGEPIKVDPKLGVLFTKKPAEIDDLKLIKGVAEVLEKKLHGFGLYRFKQIALWTDDQVAEFSDQLSFPGRIARDEWVKQATGFHAQKYGIV